MINKEIIQEKLRKVEADERLHYDSANIFNNAPLALIQTQLETESDLLRWVLELPYRKKGEKYK